MWRHEHTPTSMSTLRKSELWADCIAIPSLPSLYYARHASSNRHAAIRSELYKWTLSGFIVFSFFCHNGWLGRGRWGLDAQAKGDFSGGESCESAADEREVRGGVWELSDRGHEQRPGWPGQTWPFAGDSPVQIKEREKETQEWLQRQTEVG